MRITNSGAATHSNAAGIEQRRQLTAVLCNIDITSFARPAPIRRLVKVLAVTLNPKVGILNNKYRLRVTDEIAILSAPIFSTKIKNANHIPIDTNRCAMVGVEMCKILRNRDGRILCRRKSP